MPILPQVVKEEAAKFAQVWRHNGLFIAIDDAHIQFATDFANVVLRNFIQQCQAQVTSAMAQDAINAGKGLAPAPPPAGSKLIVEG